MVWSSYFSRICSWIWLVSLGGWWWHPEVWYINMFLMCWLVHCGSHVLWDWPIRAVMFFEIDQSENMLVWFTSTKCLFSFSENASNRCHSYNKWVCTSSVGGRQRTSEVQRHPVTHQSQCSRFRIDKVMREREMMLYNYIFREERKIRLSLIIILGDGLEPIGYIIVGGIVGLLELG